MQISERIAARRRNESSLVVWLAAILLLQLASTGVQVVRLISDYKAKQAAQRAIRGIDAEFERAERAIDEALR